MYSTERNALHVRCARKHRGSAVSTVNVRRCVLWEVDSAWSQRRACALQQRYGQERSALHQTYGQGRGSARFRAMTGGLSVRDRLPVNVCFPWGSYANQGARARALEGGHRRPQVCLGDGYVLRNNARVLQELQGSTACANSTFAQNHRDRQDSRQLIRNPRLPQDTGRSCAQCQERHLQFLRELNHPRCVGGAEPVSSVNQHHLYRRDSRAPQL
jgi:hypothetical protein